MKKNNSEWGKSRILYNPGYLKNTYHQHIRIRAEEAPVYEIR